MKLPILLICASALVASSAGAVPLCTASPGTWCEAAVGDAGSFPINSQATMGSGTITSIIGNIGNGTAGSDVYSILIQNTSQFAATFGAYTANGVTGESNAAIYLYDAQGRGVEAAMEGTSLAGFNGAAGLYYIAITPAGNAPEYPASGSKFAIFAAFSNGQISLPVAGAGAIDAYSAAGCGTNCQGAYDITLSGAQYSNAPEPAPLALLGTVLTSLSFLYRFKRSKS